MNKKDILVFCEVFLGFISMSLLFLMVYILIFPTFINPNPDGAVIVYTNRLDELWLDWFFLVICITLGIFCFLYIIYYRVKRL